MINLDFFNLTDFDRQRVQYPVKDALAKFRAGDAINDDELKNLIKFFQALEGLCAALGEPFRHQRIYADGELSMLERFKSSRKEKL